MLYPHSLLWHYLWVGPRVIQLSLAIIIWERGLYKRSPAFFFYLMYEGLTSITLYAMDISPAVSPVAWWRASYAEWIGEAPLKIAMVWEVFRHLARHRPSFRRYAALFCNVAVLLGCVALWTAAHTPAVSPSLISRVNIFGEAAYIVVCGLWLLTFLAAAYLRLSWNRWDFGIALGAGVSACFRLGTYAVYANYRWFPREYLVDFLSMTTYHICVLIWCYYLLRSPNEGAPVSGALFSPTAKPSSPAPHLLELQFGRLFP